VLFVGGSLEWKLATGGAWVRLAHAYGRPAHIGRVGTAKRVEWAHHAKADSIDSCLPLFSEEQFRGFVNALRSPSRQQYLFAA